MARPHPRDRETGQPEGPGRLPTAEATDLLVQWVWVSGERILWPPGGSGTTRAPSGEGPRDSNLPAERRHGWGASENPPVSGEATWGRGGADGCGCR